MFVSHFLFRKALLTRLSPTPVARRHSCGPSCCASTSSSTATLHADMRKRVTEAGFTEKIHLSDGNTFNAPEPATTQLVGSRSRSVKPVNNDRFRHN